MNKALAVARWEFIEKIKSKAFLVSLLLMPLLMIGFGVLPGLLASRPDTDSKVVGVIDQTGVLFDSLASRVERRFVLDNGQPNYILRRLAGATSYGEEKNRADALVKSGGLEGYFVIDDSVMSNGMLEYRSENIGNVRLVERVHDVLREVITDRKLLAYGLRPELMQDLARPIDIKTIRILEQGKEEESGFLQVFFSAYVFVMMMFFLVITSGQLLVRSMLEEKSNRIMEILMSSCTPMDLMIGKILGLSGLGLAQLGFWAVIGVALSTRFQIPMIAPEGAILLLLYFILGYVLYAALFVAAGAPVSTEQEAQQITSYLVLILLVPVMFAISVVQEPDSSLVRILSYIPFFTPTMMAVRIPIQMPEMYEIVATLVILAGSGIGVTWVAARIFRTTILMYGKKPSLVDLLHYLKTP